jgi:Ni/Co efflux regulator RcnB
MIGEMRRLISYLTAAVLVAGPLAAAGGAMAKEHRNEGRGPPARMEERRGGPMREGPPGGYRGGGPEYRGGGAYERVDPRGDPRGDPRYDYRSEQRADPRYDPRGYGPPPSAYGAAPRRGGYLGPGAGGDVIQDYGRNRLRPPPRGYEWVRTPGGMALVSQSTHQVFDVVPY